MSGSSLIFSSYVFTKLTRCCFWSSDKILGTSLAHIFCIPRSRSKMVRTDSLFKPSSSAIIRTVNLRSLCTSCFTLMMFSSVFVVEGRSDLGSFFTSSRSLLKRLCHSKTLGLDITSLPQTSLRRLKHSAGFFSSFTKNFRLLHCSILVLSTVASKTTTLAANKRDTKQQNSDKHY